MSREKKASSSEEVMSWAQMWSYFSSSFCTDEMRRWSISHMNLFDALDGKMPWVQFEILEFAPRELLTIERLRNLIDPGVLSELGWGMQQPKSTQEVTPNKVVTAEVIERFNQLKIEQSRR